VFTKGTAISSLTPTISGGAVISYSISPSLPTGLMFNTSNGVISGTPIVLSVGTDYTVIAINSGGSVSTKVNITVNDVAPIGLSYSPSILFAYSGVTSLRAIPYISGGTIINYAVSPSLPAGMSIDPLSGVITGIPISTAGTSVNYVITAMNTGGSVSSTITIVISADNPVEEPQNILTPNGDGLNDKWVIKNIQLYPNNEVLIFDKAGRLIYRKQGYNNDWDGKLNGLPLKDDVYLYIIKFNSPGVMPKKGYLTIIH
jgi:gliding motility-associated-like protein